MNTNVHKLPAGESTLRGKVSDAEWQTRQDLAACYRLCAHFRMTDLIYTHISARVPGPDHHFLINAYGLMFDEITASSLVKVDIEGKILEDTEDLGINPAGFVIHSAIHMHDPDIICVLHTHARAITAVGMQKEGLLPLSQKALLMWDLLRYHDYEGAALNLDERERIVRDIGDGRAAILRNHGGLTVGRTVAEAFCWMYRLDAACKYQVDALAGNRELQWMQPETVRHAAAQGRKILGPGGFAECGKLEWAALLRKLERDRGTSYRT